MSEARPVLVTGATGLVGTRLVRSLLAKRVPVRAVTRRASGSGIPSGATTVLWDGVRVAPEQLARCAAVVHLAGEPVFGGLPTKARRARILASRVDSTRALAQAIATLPPADRPKTLVCASAVGYYGSRGDERLDESAPPGRGFLADVCIAWEEAAREAVAHGVRTVSLRIGIVLAREGGALVPIARAFKLGIGGRLGDGRQWLPWIHVDDLVALIETAIGEVRCEGAVNAVAPNPVRNAEWTRELARAVHRPALLPVPGFVLRALLGDLALELLGSRRAVPARAQSLGFDFRVVTLARALEEELR